LFASLWGAGSQDVTQEAFDALTAKFNSLAVHVCKPQAESIIDRMACMVEVMCKGGDPVEEEDEYKHSFPLVCLLSELHLAAELGRWGEQYPALGSTPEAVVETFEKVRASIKKQKQPDTPEGLLEEAHALAAQPFYPALQQDHPDLHAAIAGAAHFATTILAEPRLLKLASYLLDICQCCLEDRDDRRLFWAAPGKEEPVRVKQWVGLVIKSLPQLGDTYSAFTEAADRVMMDARKYGPHLDCLDYELDDVVRIAQCCKKVGLFSSALEKQHAFAFTIVNNAQILEKALDTVKRT
jgi:hypothetical protein